MKTPDFRLSQDPAGVLNGGLITQPDMKEPYKPARVVQYGRKHFVYFSYLDQRKDRYVTFKWSFNLNHRKNIESRIEALQKKADEINSKLCRGWSPLDGKTYESRAFIFSIEQQILKVIDEMAFYQEKSTTWLTTRSHLRSFITFLKFYHIHLLRPEQINRAHIYDFRLWMQQQRQISNRTANNMMATLHTAFAMLCTKMIIAANPCEGIKRLPVQSSMHMPYSKEELDRLALEIQKTDPYLYVYTCLIAYCMFRPIEIVRFRISDFDFNTWIVNPNPQGIKNRESKPRLIPERLRHYFIEMNLHQYPKHFFVFTGQRVPMEKQGNRDYFTSCFSRVKKRLKLRKEYTMYGLRHTIIQMLEQKSDNELTLQEKMAFTGHTSMTAYQGYARKYVINLPSLDFIKEFGNPF